jgi:hypothetical protein
VGAEFPNGTGTYSGGDGTTHVLIYVDDAGVMFAGMDVEGAYTITVTTYEGPGGRAVGTFSGTVEGVVGGGSHVITNGVFNVGILGR